MIPSLVDLVTPFDPTGYAEITGAGLEQLVGGTTAAAASGFIVCSTDSAGNPVVPDAATNTKWQRYLWLRVGAAAVNVYVWNPNVANDAIYLRWVSISTAAIPAGGITTFMLADNAVTDAKVLAVDWSKLTNVPASFSAGGAAGGDLTGSYPNPVIATNAVTFTKLASDATVNANRAIGSDHIRDGVVKFSRQIGFLAANKFPIVDGAGTTWLSGSFGAGFINTGGVITPDPSVSAPVTSIPVKYAPAAIALATGDLTAGGLTHGLAGMPQVVRWTLVNQSTDLGYAAADEIGMDSITDGSSGEPVFIMSQSATKLFAWCRDSTAISLYNKGTGARTTADATKWKIKVNAIYFP